MGAVSFSIDPGLVTALKQALPLDVFVETGTFRGDTVELVRERFKTVHSVELSREHYEAARLRFADRAHIDLVCGDSAEALARWMPGLHKKSVLYFLDAHWCAADNTAGGASQCPLLDEIRAIGRLNDESLIVIDDARLFLAPPPAPHEISDWPDMNAVLVALQRASPSHRAMVLNDVILFFPPSAGVALREYAQHAGMDWLAIVSKLRDYDSLRTQFDNAVVQLEEKERTIHALAAVCEERAMLLQRLSGGIQTSSPSRSMDGMKKREGVLDKNVAECLARIESGNAAILETLENLQAGVKPYSEVEAAVESPFPGVSLALLQEICDARLKVIREQQAALNSVRRYSPARRLDSLFRRHRYPKLGQLCHHAPIPLQPWGLPPVPNYQRANGWPSVSIVTPSYGQVGFIGRTMDSVLNQNYPNLEYFIQDGGSTDGTVDVLKLYSARLSGWASAPDGGQSQAINLGFAKTSGEIMAWLNSDDLLLPGALAYVADYFERHPEIDVVYGHRVLVDGQDKEIGRWILPRHDDAVLSWADFIPQETLFWRRSIWEKAGGTVDENFRFAMDWDLLLRFRKVGARMACLPRFLGAFRIHEAQKTSAQISEVGMQEMDRLRLRELGHVPSRGEIGKALGPYLLAHVGCDLLFRVKTRLGLA